MITSALIFPQEEEEEEVEVQFTHVAVQHPLDSVRKAVSMALFTNANVERQAQKTSSCASAEQ